MNTEKNFVRNTRNRKIDLDLFVKIFNNICSFFFFGNFMKKDKKKVT